MNAPLQKTLSLSFTAILAALSIGSAFGQAFQVTGEKSEFDNLPSPQFAGVKNKSFKPLDWLEIEAKIQVEMKPEPKSKTCDKITVKWYVAVKNPEKTGTYLLLTKDIEHVNVPLTEEVYLSVYLSPASLRRITGTTNGGKNAVEKVGYEVLINGQKLHPKEGDPGYPGWWTVPSEKVSRSEAVPLLNKNETPFRSMWWDRYPEISVERR